MCLVANNLQNSPLQPATADINPEAAERKTNQFPHPAPSLSARGFIVRGWANHLRATRTPV